MSQYGIESQNNLEINTTVTTKEVDTLLEELGSLEVSHLGGDGKLGSGEVETIADKKYKELEVKETNTQEKIQFIKDLITQIKEKNVDNFSKIKEKKNQDFMTPGAIKEAQKLEENYTNLLKKYPEYKTGIDIFITQNFEQQAYVKNFYKENYSNDRTQYEKIMILFNEGILSYMNSVFKDIEKYIVDIKKIPAIENKSRFFEYFMKNVQSGIWDREGGMKNVEKISKLEILVNSQKESSIPVSDIAELLKLPFNKLETMNSLYKESLQNPEKEKALIEYVNSNLHEYKKTIFNTLDVYRLLFMKNEKERLGINNYEGLDFVVNDISKLDDPQNKKVMETFLVDVINFGKDDIGKMDYIKKFIRNNNTFIFGDITKDSDIKYEIIYDILYDTQSNLTKKGEKVDLSEVDAFEKKYKDKFNKNVNSFLEKNKGTPKAREIEKIMVGVKESEITKEKIIQINEIMYSQSSGNILDNPSQLINKNPQDKTGKENLTNGKFKKEIGELEQIPGITITEKGELEIKKPVKIGQNGTIELGQNGELIFMSSLGYKFNFDKDLNKSADTFFEIKNQIDFFDTVGFGFFGSSFKQMMETIQSNQSLLGGTGISISEGVGSGNNFLNKAESIQICNIFSKIGFLNEGVSPNNLTNEKVTKLQFTQKTSELSKKYGENNFYYNGNFNRKGFVEVLKQIKT